MTTRMVGVNELGRRVGQDHHHARLTDHDVELMLELHEQGYGYRKLAAKFEVCKSTVRSIIKGRSRSQVACAWRTVRVIDSANANFG